MQLVLGAFDAELLDEVRRLAQAGRVDQRERHAFDLDRLAQRIARGAGNRRDDGAFLPRQPGEQARPSPIWAARAAPAKAPAQEAGPAAFSPHLPPPLPLPP